MLRSALNYNVLKSEDISEKAQRKNNCVFALKNPSKGAESYTFNVINRPDLRYMKSEETLRVAYLYFPEYPCCQSHLRVTVFQ